MGARNALVSCPFRWDELPDIELADFTIATVPDRVAAIGDLHAALDDTPCSLAALL